MIRLAGLRFDVVPAGSLSPAERDALSRLPASGEGSAEAGTAEPSLVIELVDGPVEGEGDDLAPAAVDWDGSAVTVKHRRLDAALDPVARRGRLRRDASVGWPLEATLRTALAARLPLEGGLPLHAAGIVFDGRGVVFFGPSGAGKSTLAAASPRAAVSDEMVAVVPGDGGFALSGTGFWGTHEGVAGPRGVFPLAAVVALDKGPGCRLETLDARSALRALVACVLVPPAPPLWGPALGVVGRVVRAVPAFRLAWNPDEPWERVEEALRSGGGPLGR